jgi:diaminopimelate decarboxylase
MITKTNKLSENGKLTSGVVAKIAKRFGTPIYVYDESIIEKKCRTLLSMPNAFGLRVRYAMKANSNRTILKKISAMGLYIDASSLNEAKRANLAGIPFKKIMLTTQEVPLDRDRKDLEEMMKKGLKYNVCSVAQLRLVSGLASKYHLPISMRVHPGVGSGESATRNTGDKYSCFGVHLSDIETALKLAKARKIKIDEVHVHIGSGGDPKKWRDNIDRELGFVGKYFPEATTVNFGGGLKEARMPGEISADIRALGGYAKKRIYEFYKTTGRKLTMEIEPGTYVVANSGYIITSVIDKKQTGRGGFEFLVLNGGMELNSRPLLYGSRHPFFVVSRGGRLLSSEGLKPAKKNNLLVVVGRCCESGDSQSLDSSGTIIPRSMANADIGDYIVIGGAGAYCAAMSPFNYNSHTQAPEILFKKSGQAKLIRKEQTLKQIVQNEL